MAEEEKNQIEEPGQTPQEGATELPELTPEQIAGMKPEELVDYYANAKKAITSATQKWKEAAAMRRQAEEATEYAERMRQESIQQQQQWLDQLRESYSQPTYQQQPVETPPPAFDEHPDKAYEHLLNEMKSLKDGFADYREQSDAQIQELREDRLRDTAERSFNEHLEKKLLPKYPGVKRRDIEDYFDARPEVLVNDRTLERAAQEIHTTRQAEIDKLVELKLKEKEELAKQATVKPGAQIGTFPPGKNILDLSPEEQAQAAQEMMKRIEKEG